MLSLLRRIRTWVARNGYDYVDRSYRLLNSGPWIRKYPLVVPQPPFDDITGVLLTYHRARQCRKVVTEFMKCGMQSIVLANDGSSKPAWANDSVTWLQSSRNLGLDCRFVAAQLAQTKYVLTTGDDLLIPVDTIKSLAQEAEKKEGLIALFGRSPSSDNEYSVEQESDPEIVLAGGCLYQTSLLPLFFEARASNAFRKARLEVAALKGTHRENGEDILFSYAVKRKLGRAGYVFNFSSVQLGRGKRALYHSADHHLARTIMLRAGQEYTRDVDFLKTSNKF